MSTKLEKTDGWYRPEDLGAYTTFCVSPTGNDAADGLSETTPLQTIRKAMGLVMSLPPGKPGAVLLKAGATFVEDVYWKPSGPSPEQPHRIGIYGGTERAVLAPLTSSGMLFGVGVNNLLVEDLHIKPPVGKNGIRPRFVDDLTCQNLLIEQGDFGFNLESAVRFHAYRCVIRDQWNPPGGRSQGLYALRTEDMVCEEVVFDHNGWREDQVIGPLTPENHAVYVAEDSINPLFLNCVFSRPCSHGLQMRSGGVVEGCIWLDCPIAGFGQRVYSLCTGGFFEGSARMGHGTSSKPLNDTVRGWGWDLESEEGILRDSVFVRGGDDIDIHRPNAVRVGPVKRYPEGMPRRPRRIEVSKVRVIGWKGPGLYIDPRVPADELTAARLDLVVPTGRLVNPEYSVRPHLVRLRNLDRAGDWNIADLNRIARASYDDLPATPAETAADEIEGMVVRLQEIVAALRTRS